MNNRNIFKCCSKNQSSFICIICHSIFHNSCLERKPDVVKIGGHRILCSPNCQHNNQLAEEQEANYKQIIERLQNEVAEKENFLKRSKRNSKIFEDEIFESEQEYVNTIQEQKLRIIQLKNEISLFKENDEKFRSDMENSEEQILQLKKQIEELNDMSKSMISTIRILESENKLHLDDLSKMQQKATGRTVKSTGIQTDISPKYSEILETTTRIATNETNYPIKTLEEIGTIAPKQVLLLTDGYGKYMHQHLQKHLNDAYSVLTVCKPHAPFDNLVRVIDCYIDRFTSKDYVILLLGPEIRNFSRKWIKILSNKCFSTNLLICSSPVNSSSNLYSLTSVEIYDSMLNLSYYNKNIKLLMSNTILNAKCFVHGSHFLNKLGLAILSKNIGNSIKNFFQIETSSCNLIHIQNNDSLSNTVSCSYEDMNHSQYFNRNNQNFNAVLHSSNPLPNDKVHHRSNFQIGQSVISVG